MILKTHFLKSTGSTNEDAMLWASKGALHGSSVIAESQDSGRGRLGREWFSPPGKNLYCSIIVRPTIAAEDYPKLTMISGLAVAELLESEYQICVGLKWPNDLFVSGKKCGGILCEASLAGKSNERFAIIGIGLNINVTKQDLPLELKQRATSLYIEGGRKIQPRTLFIDLRNRLLLIIKEFEIGGFAPLLMRWRERDIFLGKSMKWVNVMGSVVYGKSIGPDENGLLHIIDAEGVEHEVMSGDVEMAER